VDHKHFLHCCDLINTSLVNQVMDRTFNSVGSNIFFEFGEQKEYILPNGKKSAQKAWSIWLSWTSWRITHRDKYIVGSDESPEISIQSFLDNLLGRRFYSLLFSSEFLDIELNFEGGYKVNTFFNYTEENQYLIFLPNDSEIVIDCSTKESIKSIQTLSKQINIQDRFLKVNFPILGERVDEISYDEGKISKLVLSSDFLVDLGTAAWRFAKNDEYYLGRLDYYFGCKENQEMELRNIISALVGKRLKDMSVDSFGMDMRLKFEEGYVFEIFSQSKAEPWKIYSKNELILHAKVESSENQVGM
jgi:hypothetical protein